MQNLSELQETVIINESDIFENAISIEKLEERLETLETCELIMMAF